MWNIFNISPCPLCFSNMTPFFKEKYSVGSLLSCVANVVFDQDRNFRWMELTRRRVSGENIWKASSVRSKFSFVALPCSYNARVTSQSSLGDETWRTGCLRFLGVLFWFFRLFWPNVLAQKKNLKKTSALSNFWFVQRVCEYFISLELINSLSTKYSSYIWLKFWLSATVSCQLIAERCQDLCFLNFCRLPLFPSFVDKTSNLVA